MLKVRDEHAVYLVYICTEVSDRTELENYWNEKAAEGVYDDVPITVLSSYTPFEVLEGDIPVEGVVLCEFPSMEAAKKWYHSPSYQKAMQHRVRGAKYLGLLVEGGWRPMDDRMPHTRRG